jgi:predicted kinase
MEEAGRQLTVVILVGLQGSGKTTFFHRHLGESYAHISMDLLRNNRLPARRQLDLLRAALASGRSAGADNTNPTVADRAALIALAREYGARVDGYYFDPDVRGSLERNRGRDGKGRVPDAAIFATRKRLQPPTYAEGFDELYRVRIGPEGVFEIQPIEQSEAADGQ